jgi:hypothetical protein
MAGVRPLGEIVRAAMDAKSRELGYRYTYRQLGKDSGVHYTYASKVVKGKRVDVDAAIICSWARALGPHFPLDEALVAANYMPDNPRLRSVAPS